MPESNSNSMKVGILTQPLGRNYGGLLQNWALQHLLIYSGYEPITLSRVAKPSLWRRLVSYYYHRYVKKDTTLPFMTHQRYLQRYQFLNDFIARNIIVSDDIYSTEALVGEIDHLNLGAIIVGSDQTWRKSYSPCLDDYFLTFLPPETNVKRISYAASFGLEKPDFSKDDSIMASKALINFDRVGVREPSGVSICSTYGVNAILDLDPTLLVHPSEYLSLCSRDIKHGKSLFVYMLDMTNEKFQCVLSYARKLEIPNIDWFLQENINMESSAWEDRRVLAPVEDFIAGIASSQFVIADSYHAAIFSYIFNRPFVIIPNSIRGVSRFEALVSLFNMSVMDNGDSRYFYWNPTVAPSEDKCRQRIDNIRSEVRTLGFLCDYLFC